MSGDELAEAMTEFSVGDRVLVPGKITGFSYPEHEYDVTYASGKSEWHYPTDLRPDTGGRDLTAQDIQDSQETWTGGTAADYRQYTAEYLNRIARGDAGSAGDDTAPAIDVRHFMLPGSHEWPRTPACNCGAVWWRDVDRCSRAGVRPRG